LCSTHKCDVYARVHNIVKVMTQRVWEWRKMLSIFSL